MVSLMPCIESMEAVYQSNQQILETQINLKNKLIKRNSEKETLLHKIKSLRNGYGKRANT